MKNKIIDEETLKFLLAIICFIVAFVGMFIAFFGFVYFRIKPDMSFIDFVIDFFSFLWQ